MDGSLCLVGRLLRSSCLPWALACGALALAMVGLCQAERALAQVPPPTATKAPPTPTQVPFSLAGQWAGTSTLTDATVAGDIPIPDPLGKDPPKIVTKEECEQQLLQDRGKVETLELEFQPTSPTGGVIVGGTDEQREEIPYRFSGNRLTMSGSKPLGEEGGNVAFSWEGVLTLEGDNLVISGPVVVKLGDLLTLHYVWTVSRPRGPNEALPPGVGGAPAATVAASPTLAPSATPRATATAASTTAPTKGPPTAAPTIGPPSVPATSAPTRATTAIAATVGPGAPTREPGRTATGKDPLGPVPPGIGGVGKVPGPKGLTEAAAGLLIPGVIGIIGGLLGGLGGGPPAPTVPAPPLPPGGPSKTGEGPPREPSAPGRDADREARRAEIRRAGERAQAEAAREGLSTSAMAGEAMEKAHTEVTELADKIGKFGSRLWGATKETAKGAVDTAKEVAANPSIIKDTLVGSAQTIGNGLSRAAGAAANAANSLWDTAKKAWADPKAAMEALGTAVKEGLGSALNTAEKTLTAVKDFVTDPAKMWATAKEVLGVNNFGDALDPNRSLGDRIASVGIGVVKIYTTIQTAGMVGGAMKKGATVVAETLGVRGAGGQAAKTAIGVAESTAARTGVRTLGKEAVSSEGLLAKGARGLREAPGIRPDLRGIPKGQLEAIKEIAERRGIDIAVRPTTADAMPWLQSGRAIPKPGGMYNKSISMIDEMIGAPQGRRGLIGSFEPKLPPMPKDPKLRAEVMDRFLERTKEWRTYRGQMEHLQSTGKIKVVNGVIHDAASGKPFVSDIDLAGFFKNGKPVSEDVGRWIYGEIRKKCPGVVHPEINSWYATGKKAQGIMDKVMGGHGPGGTPLVVVGPKGIGGGFFK